MQTGREAPRLNQWVNLHQACDVDVLECIRCLPERLWGIPVGCVHVTLLWRLA